MTALVENKISIIVPAYNEEYSIVNTIHEIKDFMNGYDDCGWWELIIVNDGSTDNTLNLLNEFKKKHAWLKVIDLGANFGRGRALKKGIEKSAGDIIVTLDADLSYAPYHIERMIKKLKSGNADVVVVSAYCKQGTVNNVPFLRLLTSRIGNLFLSYMYRGDITVLTCIVRGYQRSFISRLDLHSDNKDIHLEILYKAKMLGAKIIEVPGDLNWKKDYSLVRDKIKKRRSTFKLRKTSRSHFFFALLSRPGVIYFIPGSILLMISFYIFILGLMIIIPDVLGGMTMYMAVRKSMLNATPSWVTFAISFILSIQFFSIGFLTNQNKKNYEETYKTLNKVLSEIKKKK